MREKQLSELLSECDVVDKSSLDPCTGRRCGSLYSDSPAHLTVQCTEYNCLPVLFFFLPPFNFLHFFPGLVFANNATSYCFCRHCWDEVLEMHIRRHPPKAWVLKKPLIQICSINSCPENRLMALLKNLDIHFRANHATELSSTQSTF